jgi:hypothetical protein
VDDALQFSRRRPSFGLRAYAGWVFASTAAVLLGMASIYLLIFAAKAIIPGVNEDRLMGRALFPLLGAFIGAGQWLLLRGRVRRSGWWIVATAAGLWLGAIVAFRAVGMQLPIGQLDLLLAGAGVGLCLGLAQLPVLRADWRRSLIWLLVSALGWLCLAAVVGQSLDRTSDLLALGAVPAAFTGLALAWFRATDTNG